MSMVFAGQVATGPVEVEVEVLRRGRSMSQCTATVRNPGAEAGLTAVAVFGAPRRGFSFVDATPPAVAGPDGVRSFRDPVPEGVDFTFARPPMAFWEEIVDGRPVLGRAPWEPHEDGPAEMACWYKPDQPPLGPGGDLDPLAAVVMCDMMPGSVSQKVGPTDDIWFGPSADYTIHLFGDVRPGWLLGHSRARWAGDGYASVEMTLWDRELRTPVAYATQVMFFAFGR
jgi:acyl-CoA thioesterase